MYFNRNKIQIFKYHKCLTKLILNSFLMKIFESKENSNQISSHIQIKNTFFSDKNENTIKT